MASTSGPPTALSPSPTRTAWRCCRSPVIRASPPRSTCIGSARTWRGSRRSAPFSPAGTSGTSVTAARWRPTAEPRRAAASSARQAAATTAGSSPASSTSCPAPATRDQLLGHRLVGSGPGGDRAGAPQVGGRPADRPRCPAPGPGSPGGLRRPRQRGRRGTGGRDTGGGTPGPRAAPFGRARSRFRGGDPAPRTGGSVARRGAPGQLELALDFGGGTFDAAVMDARARHRR